MKPSLGFSVQTLVAAAFVLMTGAAQATLVVNLQPSADWLTATNAGSTVWTTVTGDYDNDNGGTPDDVRTGVNALTLYSPAGASGFTGSQSSRFYYTASVTTYNSLTAGNDASTVLSNNQINKTASSYDVISFGSSAATINAATFAVIWKKEDFLGTGNLAGNSVNLTSNTALSFLARTPNASSFSYQWLVQIGGVFYVSQEKAFINGTTNGSNDNDGTTTITSSGLTTTLWASVDLAGPDGILSSVGGTYTTLDLEDIQAVGVYFTSTTAGSKRVFLSGFSADATISAVPEPSSFAVLAGFFALGMAGLRRRRRR